MRRLPPEGPIFLSLASLTLLSWFLAEGAFAQIAGSAALLIGALKVRLVFVNFMELSSRVQPWRWIFDLWIGAVTVSLLLGYWLSRI